ncbi:MAG TPA: divalent-cation tolerance protein CutA [Anaerolineales bacterium]|nr:divalent-cation tolerance protein CutA [Anaerolineales bacterium]
MESSQRGCVIMTTTNDAAEAERLAHQLVRRGLAACVQSASVTSHYLWEGTLERQAEFLLFIKTVVSRYAQVEEFLRRTHSYSVPEIAMLPLAGGSDDYLGWLRQNSRGEIAPEK